MLPCCPCPGSLVRVSSSHRAPGTVWCTTVFVSDRWDDVLTCF